MAELSIAVRYFSVALILCAGLLCVLSLIRFSSVLVKLVIIEVLSNLLMAGIALWALLQGKPIFLDVCLAFALIMFLGAVAYYQFLFERENSDVDFSQ